MTPKTDLGLLLLHALPFDGRMWKDQLRIIPERTYAPHLYQLGTDLKQWAAHCLQDVPMQRLVVVGCSVGGSCALEVLNLAPERVAATILVGTKPRHDPNPRFAHEIRNVVKSRGIEAAWEQYWKPLFAQTDCTDALKHPALNLNRKYAVTLRVLGTFAIQDVSGLRQHAVKQAETMALEQSREDLIRGLNAFHTRTSREDVVAASHSPIHIVTGDQDTLPGQAYAHQLAALNPKAHLHIIENCGHYVPMMQPNQTNALIADVIQTVEHAKTSQFGRGC